MIRRKGRPNVSPEKTDAEDPTQLTAIPETSEEQIRDMYNLTLKWTQQLERSRIAQYTELLNRPWRLIWLNILSGTARGVGIAVGFTFFAATIIYVLQVLGALNLPIIGDYIADIVRIVQRQLELNTY
ncbi:DUF5665 domain-containing protein [Paenibacillus lutimineralis]|uniref:Uncharacterized protein n=1 Tax=Paenibacillus lutimineralis TaxID=2707005 RepID=A0A3Q9IA32_9BACL|nr:DUF5665 domain-containing protein [Paenibacillus lutimineralis]AZS14525.1 hypothetical protein EI981_08695 [Paenibacillus lutimineralis]